MTNIFPSPGPDRLLADAVAAAREAGKAVMEVYKSNFVVERKEDLSPLTLADKRSHEIIVRRISSSDAGSLPILSEEGKNIPYDVRKGWEFFWLVDPLDGTKEFIKRNGEFTVNIALIHENRPILGVIYVPVTDTLYYACEGSGAHKEHLGRTIELPGRITKERFTIAGSRSHATPELVAFVEEMKKKHGDAEFISAGSSLKFCLVAEGKADVYPRFGPTMEWDTAAGQAIAEQAGTAVINMATEKPLVYNKQNLLNPWFMVTRLRY